MDRFGSKVVRQLRPDACAQEPMNRSEVPVEDDGERRAVDEGAPDDLRIVHRPASFPRSPIADYLADGLGKVPPAVARAPSATGWRYWSEPSNALSPKSTSLVSTVPAVRPGAVW